LPSSLPSVSLLTFHARERESLWREGRETHEEEDEDTSGIENLADF